LAASRTNDWALLLSRGPERKVAAWTTADPHTATLNHFDLSHHTSAFAMDYRERLATNEQTAWAQGLDEFNLGILLWMVGEYGIRVNCSEGPDGADYPPPGFKADSYMTKPMRAALRLIAKIEDGKAITMAEAKRRIAEDDG
jgi:hypothetical protein